MTSHEKDKTRQDMTRYNKQDKTRPNKRRGLRTLFSCKTGGLWTGGRGVEREEFVRVRVKARQDKRRQGKTRQRRKDKAREAKT